MIGGVDPDLLRVLGGIFAALAAGSAARFLALHGASEAEARPLLDSLKVWWAVAAAVAVATLTGRIGAVLLLAGVSGVGLHELFRLTDDGGPGGELRVDAYVAVAVGLLLVALDEGMAFLVLFPPAIMIWICVRLVLRDRAEGFLRTGGGWLLGVLLVGYAPAHAALLFSLPPDTNPVAGPAGWFLALVVLDQTSDIVQALVGRRVGARRIAPVLSPRKTWEGFLGGVAGTVLLAMVLLPALTPLVEWESALAGLVIAGAGFVGDVTISGIKREAGVKDSGAALPGHGGMLDRADSLLLSAPVYYYLVILLT